MAQPAYTTPEYYHCLDDERFRDRVYEPEADTFLFLDALDTEAARLRALHPRRCVEVGCGSGTVLTHLFAVLHGNGGGDGGATEGTQTSAFYAVDVNPTALEATSLTWSRTLEKYFAAIAVPEGAAEPPPLFRYLSESAEGPPQPSPYTLTLVHGDLLAALDQVTAVDPQGPPMEGGLDVILFNPPYVPTSLEELEDAVAQRDVITAAWCGGPRGRVVLDRFLSQLPRYLSDRGVCYVVLIRENDEADVAARVEQVFRAHLGLATDASQGSAAGSAGRVTEMVAVARRYTGEHLSVHRISYARPLDTTLP